METLGFSTLCHTRRPENIVGVASDPYLVALGGEKPCSYNKREPAEGSNHAVIQQTFSEPPLSIGHPHQHWAVGIQRF